MKQFFFISCLASFFTIYGQTITHYNYSVAEGLPSSEAYTVFQDRQGFMWFATDNGVVKFDGREMQTFHLKDGLTDPVVFDFQEDDDGRIWFWTYSGKLSYYENGQIKPYPHNDKLKRIGNFALINFVYLSETKELWFSMRNCFGKIDSKGEITIDTLNSPLERKALIYKTIGNKDLLIPAFAHTGVQCVIVNDVVCPVKIFKTTFINRVLRKLYWKGKLYLSTSNQVLEFDGKNIRTVIEGKNPVICLAKDNNDNLWVGYLNAGVEQFSSNDFKKSMRPDFLKKKSVTQVCQSRDGALWFSTLENGIYYVPNLFIKNFPLAGDSKIKSITSHDNHIVVGDKAAGITFYDNKDQSIRHSKSFSFSIEGMFTDSRNNLWVSAHSGIFVYDSNFVLKKTYQGRMASDFFEELGFVWIVGSLRTFKFNNQLELVKEDTLRDLYRSMHLHDTLIYFAGRIGLHVRDKNLELVSVPKDFANYKISDITSLNDSTLLIATTGNGFVLLNTRRWSTEQYHTENKFIANNIYAVLKKDSLLWLGTENGLAVTPIKSLVKGKPSFNYLSKAGGLISNAINFLAPGHKSIWAFSDAGFSVIPDNFTRFANKNPVYFIKKIFANGASLSLGKPLALEPDQNNIKIDFGFISFNNQNIFQRYRLNSKEPWINTNDRSVQLSSLAPGKYLFELEFSPDNINWANALKPIPFVIAEPWWGRWYFYPVLFLILSCLGYLYFRYQQSIYKQKHHFLRIINEHQQKLLQSEVVTLERERNRIAKELHDRVGTNLSAIKLMVSQLLKNSKEPTATEVEDQFQIAIKEIKDIIYGLTPPSLERYGLFTGLKNYIGKLNKTIPLNISLKPYGNESYVYEVNIMIFRVLQELLTNSIKHSFAKNINIHVNVFEDMINVVYEDDGVGFSYDPVQSGLGLNGIESRIQSVNGTLKFESGTFGVSYTIDVPLLLKKEAV